FSGFHGRSFKEILKSGKALGWDEVYASHTFHEVTMYYPMRAVMNRHYKLIWNIAWKLDYPFASDLWASPTWQGVIRNKADKFGKRTVNDYLQRAEFELYDLVNDSDEIHNLAGVDSCKTILLEMTEKLKQFQKSTMDPWIVQWSDENIFGVTGVNL
ncbi:MAG: heparan N-sulfatase, partial [Bacteroidales bacterium]|nr:heparan N-sulfatase [Bacteroidales bacterium]